MLIIIGTILAIFIGFIVYVVNNPLPNPYSKMTSRELAKLCLPMEGDVMHIHPQLTIIAKKQSMFPPAQIGVNAQKGCMGPLHVHDANGIIHIESPIQKDFTLGDFFAVWDKTLSRNQILDDKVDSEHGLKMYVNGKESTDFENLILKDKQSIVIDYYNLKDGPDDVPGVDQNAPLA